MKKLLVIVAMLAAVGLALSGPARAQQTPAASPPKAPASSAQKTTGSKSAKTTAAPSQASTVLKTQKEKSSYALGMNIGKGLSRQQLDIDAAMLERGLRDGLGGGKTLLTDDEVQAALAELQGEANMKEGVAFLADNKTKDGVVTLPSGLQYKILTAGSGPKPSASDTVVCNYRGTLVNGTEFDSSYKRGQPASFPVSGVIKGWTEALQLMPVGSKWQLFIPPNLAYGPSGRGGVIGPEATLIFEVELLSIKGK
ncbi:MAG TPA: FKBP-type peptidyl-prolyl cis-trans isomerase [Candidatus Acidoferrales bacterium]|nr:FKBP-type peptidyl-prolyl cis-trans isomerase [Candidatus Acidoferrales bacterium]